MRFRLFLALTLTVLFALAFGQPLLAKDEVVLWHTLDKTPAKVLNDLIREFNQSRSILIRAETGMELTPSLITQVEAKQSPDVVLAPSDQVGLAQRLGFSECPKGLIPSNIEASSLASVTAGKKIWGIPVLEGNHLVLYYNKTLVKEPVRDWEELNESGGPGEGAKSVSWIYRDPYLFFAFAAAFGVDPMKRGMIDLDTGDMRAALEFYKNIEAKKVVSKECDYECVTSGFYTGKAAYAINGDWAWMDAKRALGPKLGVAALPRVAGRPIQSFSATHALMFPSHSLEGKHAQTLKEFARFLTSPTTQKRWLEDADRIPVDHSLLTKLRASKDANTKFMMEGLARSRRVANDTGMLYVWPAVRRELTLFCEGVVDGSGASKAMQALAMSQFRDDLAKKVK